MDSYGLTKKNIAVFDSGVGGLTVLAPLMETLLGAHFIYYADLHHVPYGTKSSEDILAYMDQCMQVLLEENIDLLLLACNTATSVAASYLRNRYPDIPIVGMEPAVKPAAHVADPKKKIIVSATDLTLRLEKLERLIDDLGIGSRIERLSLQELVHFAEQGVFQGAAVEAYLKKQLSDVDIKHSATLVLGCTHFVYYAPLIKTLLPAHIQVVDGNQGTVNRVKYFISDVLGNREDMPCFIVSGQKPTIEEKVHLERCLAQARML